MATIPTTPTVLRKKSNWRTLHFYHKADTLYQLTIVFCKRFLPSYGDRTVDQMVQAARSGKQNIVEGCEDGLTSTEMEIKLINVARSSLQELREDYEDYLNTHHLSTWDAQHPRYDRMLQFCRTYNSYDHYVTHVYSLGDEALANVAITLCRFTDKMITTYLQYLEKRFIEEGGIKERMHAARSGFRQLEEQRIHHLQSQIAQLQQALLEKDEEIQRLREILGLVSSKGAN
jgi:four helix bundle suffix protein